MGIRGARDRVGHDRRMDTLKLAQSRYGNSEEVSLNSVFVLLTEQANSMAFSNGIRLL